MINLINTSSKIKLTTSSTAGIDVSASYAEFNGTTVTPSGQTTKISTATTTDIVGVPGSSTVRNIKGLIVTNIHASTANSVSISHFDGTNTIEIWSGVLLAGETVEYVDTKGFVKYSADGQVQTTYSASSIIGGTDKQIQFNNSGVFGGDADLTWNSSTNTLALGGADTGVNLTGITNEPSAPSAGTLRFYSKSIAGRMVPKIVGPSGIDTPLQNALWQNNTVLWTPTTVTAGVWLGTAGAGAGTYTTQLPTTTNLYTAMKRARWANVITTTNQVLGQRNTEAMFFLGNTAGQGGFFFYARAGFDVWTNGGRFFAGMHSGTTVVSANPSALNNTCGFAVDDSDNGLIYFMTRNGSTTTRTSTGLTITTNAGYDFYIFAAPNSTTIGWRIVDIVNGTDVSGSTSSTTPVANTMLTAGVLASNAALTAATAIQLGLNRIYVETDR